MSPSLMLLAHTTKVKPEVTLKKILYLYPAENDTFVILGMRGVRQDIVWHINKKGKILFNYVFPYPMDAFGMLNQREAIML